MVKETTTSDEYVGYGKVVRVSIQDEQFVITCEKQKICVSAYGECCSYSWFEYPNDLNQLVGKYITNIVMTDEDADLPESGYDDCDQNMVSYIYTKNSEPLLFYLRNSSNGYYGGWFDIVKEDHHEPMVPTNMFNLLDKFSDLSIHTHI